MCVYVHIFFIYTGWEKTKQVGTEPLNWEVCEQHVPTMVRVPGHSTHHYSSLRIISAVLFTNVMLLGLQLQFEGSRIGGRDRTGKSWKDDSWFTFLYGTATICFTKSMTGTSPKGSKRIQNLRKCEASSRLDVPPQAIPLPIILRKFLLTGTGLVFRRRYPAVATAVSWEV